MDWEQIDLLIRKQYYILGMRPVFRPSALFSDETENYVSPMEPDFGDDVTIRFRTKKDNVDAVFLCMDGEKRLMTCENERYNKYFDYYYITLEKLMKPIRYSFEVHVGKLVLRYDKFGITKDFRSDYQFMISPGFKTPDWAKGAVMYQIYVDRFYNGDPSNDVTDREYYYLGDFANKVWDWDRNPATYMGIREFYGGDIQGIMDKLDYLQDLGVDVIYLNPIFVSPSNHKYDSQDYDYVDPHLGRIVHDGGEPMNEWDHENSHASKYIKRVTDYANLEASNQLFAEFVQEAHKRNMKVILDGVFNHCGSFNKWMDRERIYEGQPGYAPGAYISADSPYRRFFKFHNEDAWPYNPHYDGWWGHDTLPKLTYEDSQELHDYILRIGAKWVSPPYNADGWRLDVAADLGFSSEYNHKFWREFREVVKQANPNAIILAEHYGDARSWLQGDQWDTVMNYDAFMEPLTWFFTGMEKHSDQFRPDLLGNGSHFEWAMKHYMSSFMAPSLQVAMNELSNHDHSRFLTRTNHKAGRVDRLGCEAASEGVVPSVMRQAVMMQFTWPGAPTIYYGDEAGVCGFTDPDNRRTYPWGREDHQMIDFHKEMIRIHKGCAALMKGSVMIIKAEKDFLAYGRFTDMDQVLIAFNNADEEVIREVRVKDIGVLGEDKMVRLMLTTSEGYSTEQEILEVKYKKIALKMPPHSGVVLRAMRGGRDR